MSDITMCVNDSCPLRHKCYRSTAKPSKWQSYSEFHPVEVSPNKWECDNLWKDVVEVIDKDEV